MFKIIRKSMNFNEKQSNKTKIKILLYIKQEIPKNFILVLVIWKITFYFIITGSYFINSYLQ